MTGKMGMRPFKQPFSPEEFIAAVNRYISYRPSQHACMKNKSIVSWLADRQPLIGKSSFIRRIKAYLLKVAAVDSHVLITGETGTGKELTAQYIHQKSTRHGKPLITINCAALPDGLLESELFGYEKGAFTGAHTTYAGKLKLADGGTVFFDEIGDMSPYAQAKILRVIENKEVHPLGGKRSIPLDIRIIAATNRDLERLVSKKKFRQDLYFRLNVARVHLPPLRERKEDIPGLMDYYLQEFNDRFGWELKGFTDEALELMLRYDWPGNVRELKNLLEAIFIDPPLDRIAISDLPDSIRQHYEIKVPATLTERERLFSALCSVNWNKSKAAKQLHWSRMTLYRKMAKHHIRESKAGQPPWPRPSSENCNIGGFPVTAL
jgi:transcriptional regulator with PAS, ATPase and Fis domain